MTWLDLPYRWLPPPSFTPPFNTNKGARLRYLCLAPFRLKLLWSIRVEDIGTVWEEDSIVYDDNWGLWTIRGITSIFEWGEEDIEEIGFSLPTSSWTLPTPPPDPSHFPSSTRLLNLDLFHALGVVDREFLAPLVSWSGYRACRLRYTTTVPTVKTPESLRFLFFFTLMEIVLEALRCPGLQRADDVLWAAKTALELGAAMKIHRFLPWLCLPRLMDQFQWTTRTQPLLEAYTLHRFYFKDQVRQTGDAWILEAWSQLSNVSVPHTNLLYYLPPLETLDNLDNLDHLDHLKKEKYIPLRSWLPDERIPRVTKTEKPNENPRFSLLNPSILSSDHDYFLTLRTANYHLETYESRDVHTKIVETRNFLFHLPPLPSTIPPTPIEIPDDLHRALDTQSTIVGLEDIRLFFYNPPHQTVYFLANTCNVPGNARMPSVVWGRFSLAEKKTLVVPLRFGQRVEKNWVPWIVQGHYLLVYSFSPLVVLSIDPLMHADDSQLEQYRDDGGFRPRMVFCTSLEKSKNTILMGPSCPIRGSGSLIEVTDESGDITGIPGIPGESGISKVYWGLVHQVMLGHNGKRRYFHRVVEISLGGNYGVQIRFSSPFTFHANQYRVEYAMGIAPVSSSSFWITYSIMDEDPRMVHVSRSHLQDLLDKGTKPVFHPGTLEWEGITKITREITRLAELLQGWPRRTFWINRSCDRSRRLQLLRRVYAAGDGITSLVPGTEFIRIDAVDGTDPRVRDSWPLARYFRNRKKDCKHHNEKTVALTLSHFKALETALYTKPPDQTDDDWVMIVEDDFTLDHLPLWPCSMADLLHYLNQGQYGTHSKKKDKKIGLCSLSRLFRLSEEKYSPTSLWEPIRYYGTTLGYLVRYGAIPSMLQAFYETLPEKLFVSDYEVFRTAERAVMTTLSWLVPPYENTSTLHPQHENFQRKCLGEFRDAFYPEWNHQS